MTGQPSSLGHRGNHVIRGEGDSSLPSSIWPSFEGRFDSAGYLSTHSDIVAPLVFNHQMHGMNLLARLGWEARVAGFQAAQTSDRQIRPLGALSDVPVALDAAATELVDYFLFVDEAAFPVPLRGGAEFTTMFEAQGPRDSRGRSLHQLDLKTRLLRYPCSYLIYSEAFEALPDAARRAIYDRMWSVLSGAERGPRYRRLSAADRRAIVEILSETKADWPAAYR